MGVDILFVKQLTAALKRMEPDEFTETYLKKYRLHKCRFWLSVRQREKEIQMI